MRWPLTLAAVLAGCTLGVRGSHDALQPPVEGVPELDAGCHVDTTAALLRCVDQARIAEDIRRLAVPRGPGSPGHQAARTACRERFADLGYEVSEEDYDGGTNVIAVKRGVTTADERVVVSAHYDGVPGCAAADDNASGVAVLFEVARVLADARFTRSLVVACWDGGEQGQAGSAAYARKLPPKKVRGMIALESVAYRSDDPETQRVPEGFERLFPKHALRLLDNDDRADFATIVADLRTEPWAAAIAASAPDLHVEVLVLTDAVKVKQKKLHRSDHASFWDAQMPAILLTDTGPFRNPHHHCKAGVDDPERLDFAFAAQIARLAVVGAARELELRSPAAGFAQ